MTLLAINDVLVAYGNLTALQGVTLKVNEGEVVSLIGSNGAGKSTLLKAIMRLVHVGGGDIEFDGISVLQCHTHEMARLGVAFVPEGRGTLRRLSVRENLLLGAFPRSNSAEIKSDFERVVEQFPMLKERLSLPAGALSGGQQQMLVIGRALMCRPRLMLLDEPSLGLAPLVTKQIFDIIAGLTSQRVTVLLVEQNARAGLKLAKRAYVLELGRIVLEGNDLLGNPRVREAYLGEANTADETISAPPGSELA
jgi:branched-chain amino acid transport system ATP-binding protein